MFLKLKNQLSTYNCSLALRFDFWVLTQVKYIFDLGFVLTLLFVSIQIMEVFKHFNQLHIPIRIPNCLNSPAVLGLGMSSIGIIILTDFSLQIHLCFRFTQNSRQITEFIKDLSCTTLRFHRIFTWEKIKGGVEILSHFLQFESWQVTPSNFVLETFFCDI